MGNKDKTEWMGKLKKEYLLAAILLGILLMVIVWPTASEPSGETTGDHVSELVKKETEEGFSTEETKERLEAVLSKIQGAGKVEVMMTWKSSREQVIEKDRSSTADQNQQQDSQSEQSNVQESTVYQKEGTGETPYVTKELAPVVSGVLVVADGGDDGTVVREITEAIEALFGIETHKIKVVRRKAGAS